MYHKHTDDTAADKPEEQNETEIFKAQEPSGENFGKQDAETKTEKESASSGIETAETVTEQEMEEITKEALTTVICKRQNMDMPEYVFPETVELTEFEDLSYRLFISCEMIHVDGGLFYWDYGYLPERRILYNLSGLVS